ncbi:phage tail tube protein [Halodurantibacterium flavum]|uniref:Phage tail tube protein n=1 Tax=Halodurantibacterium flavum TaxID=1382802 RepID=A0ABW4S888_9RHOB
MSFTGVGLGYGARIRIGRGATPAWTTLIGPGDFELPAGEVDEIEATSHDSPNRTKEFIPGLTDNGTMTVPVDYIPGNDQDVLLRELRRTGELIQLEITPAGGTPELWAAWVKSYGRSAPVNGKATATIGFRINGEIIAEGGN